jgi:hypothetical protein
MGFELVYHGVYNDVQLLSKITWHFRSIKGRDQTKIISKRTLDAEKLFRQGNAVVYRSWRYPDGTRRLEYSIDTNLPQSDLDCCYFVY